MAILSEKIKSLLTFKNSRNINIFRITENKEYNIINLSLEGEYYKLNFPFHTDFDKEEIKQLIKILKKYT